MGLSLVVVSGLLAGAVHVVTGVDHLAALLPLSVGRRLQAWSVGARWGLGHSAGVLVIGLAAVLLRERLDLAVVEAWGERLVGVMLVALGAWGLRRASGLHVHEHEHEGQAHAHLHAHAHAAAADHHDPSARHHGHAAFVAGVLHGVAGTAHLLGVLPALALPGWPASLAYLLAFAAGTIAAMAGFAATVGEGSVRLGAGVGRLRQLAMAAGLLTIAVGLGWLGLALAG